MSSIEPEIHDTGVAPQTADLALRQGREQAWKQFADARTAEDFCGSWLTIQCQIIGGVVDGVVVLQKPGSKALAPVAFYPDVKRTERRWSPSDKALLTAGNGRLYIFDGWPYLR